MATVKKYYQAYTLDPIMGSEKLSLEPVKFRLWREDFESKKDLIKALIEEEKKYETFIILQHIRIYEGE